MQDPRLAWLKDEAIRPYVLARQPEFLNSQARQPHPCFQQSPLVIDPQKVANEDFITQIINLENTVFTGTGLAMPRWVFYDCGIMPGITTGFAIHRDKASPELKNILKPKATSTWLPLALFIVIPTLVPNEWVAHNLTSVNSLLPDQSKYYGLGFLSKAFGLWYGGIPICCGMTQWRSPALRLHSHYGDLQVMTAYTPAHSVPQTVTYRLRVRQDDWEYFFKATKTNRFSAEYKPSGLTVDRKSETSMQALQAKIEAGQGPYYLNAYEVAQAPLDSELTVYAPLS